MFLIQLISFTKANQCLKYLLIGAKDNLVILSTAFEQVKMILCM